MDRMTIAGMAVRGKRLLKQLGGKPTVHTLTDEGSLEDFWTPDEQITATPSRTATENAVYLASHLKRPPHLLLRTISDYEAPPAAVGAAIANPRYELEWLNDFFLTDLLEGSVPEAYLAPALAGLLSRWQWSSANTLQTPALELFADTPGSDVPAVAATLAVAEGLDGRSADLLAKALTQGLLGSLSAELIVSAKRFISAFASRALLPESTISALKQMDERERAS